MDHSVKNLKISAKTTLMADALARMTDTLSTVSRRWSSCNRRLFSDKISLTSVSELASNFSERPGAAFVLLVGDGEFILVT